MASRHAAGRVQKRLDEPEAVQSMKRDGTPCGRLAMTRYGLAVCGVHGGYGVVAPEEMAQTDTEESPLLVPAPCDAWNAAAVGAAYR